MALEPAAVRRLQRDWRELLAEPLDTCVAEPVDGDLAHWAANLRPLDGSLLGACFHFHLRFPPNYPHAPPEVRFDCPPSFDHPNVFGTTDSFVCLDMLRAYETGEAFRGWTCAYTVSSVVLQLQSFLLGSRDVDQDYGSAVRVHRRRANMRQIVRETLEFRCPCCAHRGMRPLPRFFREHAVPVDRVPVRVLADLPCVLQARGRRVVVENRRELWMMAALPDFAAAEGVRRFDIKVVWAGRCCGKLNQRSGLGLCRVGWGTRDATALGTDLASVGYGGTGKLASAGEYADYGPPFGKGQVVSCFVDLANRRALFAARGKALRSITLTLRGPGQGEPLVPMLAVKNCAVEVAAYESLGPAPSNLAAAWQAATWAARPQQLAGPAPGRAVCRDFLRGACRRPACRYRHPDGAACARASREAGVLALVFDGLTVQELYIVRQVCAQWAHAQDEWSSVERRSVACFATRLGPQEATLGLGVRGADLLVSPLPLSAEAFQSGVKKSAWKEMQFDLLLPLAVGPQHAQAAEPHLDAALAALGALRPEPLVALLPALMDAQVRAGAAEAWTRCACERALNAYCAMHHLLLRYAEREPRQRAAAADLARGDDLGVGLAALSLGGRYAPVAGRFMRCALRQAAPALVAAFPELRKPGAEAVSWTRINQTWAGAQRELRLAAFRAAFLLAVEGTSLQAYDRRLGRPPAGQVEALYKRLAALDSWPRLFRAAGLGAKTPGQLTRLLEEETCYMWWREVSSRGVTPLTTAPATPRSE